MRSNFYVLTWRYQSDDYFKYPDQLELYNEWVKVYQQFSQGNRDKLQAAGDGL